MNVPPANSGSDPPHPRIRPEPRPSVRPLSLVLYPERVLRTVCEPVESFDSTLRDIAAEMLGLMQQHRGIGLAAPQVGLRRRLIVCALELPAVLVEERKHQSRPH